MNILERWRKNVAQHAHYTALLLEDERRHGRRAGLGYGFVPRLQKRLQFVVKLRYGLAFGRRPDYNAEIFGFDALHKVAQTQLFAGGLDFLRYRNFIAEGDEHHIAPCERYFGGESGTFRRDGFFYNLHQEFAAAGQLVGHGAVLVDVGQQLHARNIGQLAAGALYLRLLFLIALLGVGSFGLFAKKLFEKFGIRRKSRAKIQIMQKSILLVAHVDEGGVQTRHQLFHLCQIDVADSVGYVAVLLLERNEPTVLEQGDRHLLGLNVDYQFAFHCLSVVRNCFVVN